MASLKQGLPLRTCLSRTYCTMATQHMVLPIPSPLQQSMPTRSARHSTQRYLDIHHAKVAMQRIKHNIVIFDLQYI